MNIEEKVDLIRMIIVGILFVGWNLLLIYGFEKNAISLDTFMICEMIFVGVLYLKEKQ